AHDRPSSQFGRAAGLRAGGATRARRQPAVAVRRDVGGALPHAELCLCYSRYANPTVAMFEERMRLLEGAEAARATATGMAAVTSALLCFLKAGDHVVAARALFGSCRYVVDDLCPRFGIASTLVDGRDIKAWERAVRPNTKAFFFETPANPTLDLVDIKA